jgi:hypothetical protein
MTTIAVASAACRMFWCAEMYLILLEKMVTKVHAKALNNNAFHPQKYKTQEIDVCARRNNSKDA